jgi:hypothetical protein
MLLNGSTNAEYLLIEAPCYQNKIGITFYIIILRWIGDTATRSRSTNISSFLFTRPTTKVNLLYREYYFLLCIRDKITLI